MCGPLAVPLLPNLCWFHQWDLVPSEELSPVLGSHPQAGPAHWRKQTTSIPLGGGSLLLASGHTSGPSDVQRPPPARGLWGGGVPALPALQSWESLATAGVELSLGASPSAVCSCPPPPPPPAREKARALGQACSPGAPPPPLTCSLPSLSIFHSSCFLHKAWRSPETRPDVLCSAAHCLAHEIFMAPRCLLQLPGPWKAAPRRLHSDKGAGPAGLAGSLGPGLCSLPWGGGRAASSSGLGPAQPHGQGEPQHLLAARCPFAPQRSSSVRRLVSRLRCSQKRGWGVCTPSVMGKGEWKDGVEQQQEGGSVRTLRGAGPGFGGHRADTECHERNNTNHVGISASFQKTQPVNQKSQFFICSINKRSFCRARDGPCKSFCHPGH